jgi:hypothetical protein
MKMKFKKLLVPLVLAILLHYVETVSSAPVLVDSYLGGGMYSTAPFAGLTAVTANWQNLGGIFVPSQTSQLTEFDVSIFAETGTQGAARLTIFRYDQPVGSSTYVNIGPTLGYAEVAVGSYGALVAFDFSTQSIQLQAGQTYAYMLSNPLYMGLGPAWRRVDYYSSGLEINSSDRFVGGGFDYATVSVGASQHYQVFANVVPEPGSLTFAVGILGAAVLRRLGRQPRMNTNMEAEGGARRNRFL